MTREEAISLLSQVNHILVNSNSWLENTHEPLNIAFDTAIKALEKELCEDCVSRKAVLDILSHYAHNFGADNEIKALPSVTSTTRWIPVSERLPEDYQRVLITVVNYDGDKVVRVAVYYDFKKIFKVKENTENWKVGEEGLLAWQSLPKSYKEEKESEE